MIELFKLGRRNIFRNKRRTILTSIVIGIGLASMIFQSGLLKGMVDNIFNTAGDTFLGQGQIHQKSFLLTNDVEMTIENKDQVTSILNNDENIKAYSNRVMSISMLSSARNGVSIRIYGVDVDEEAEITKLKKAVREGSYELNDNSIMIGNKLAELLEVKLGDHIIATVAQAHTGALSQELFEISGIYSFNEPALDKHMAFIDIKKAQTLLNIGDNIHEIVLKLKNPDLLNPINPLIKEKVDDTGNEILSLQEILPSLKALIEMSKYGTFITMVIVFLLVVFIIMNTLFMSLFERMKEFGVLKAIGTSPYQIFSLIVIEAGSLALFSCFIGELFGLFCNFIIGKIGIRFDGIEVGGVTMTEPIYPIFCMEQISIFPIAIFIFILIVALYPAIYAARIIPIKALQRND